MKKTFFWVVGILIFLLVGGGMVGITNPQRMIILMILVLISAAISFIKAVKSEDTITSVIFYIISLTMIVCVYSYFKQFIYF